MLRLLAHLLLLGNVLSAARAGRNWSDMVGALFDGAEREWANTTQVGLLDVPGIGIMNHIEECIVR